MKVGVVSLGCDKNRVDAEKLLARLEGEHTIVSSEEEADVIIVNTCAFIDSAKEESIDEILTALEQKKADPKKKVIVTGCLAQRYKSELAAELKDVDAFLGIADYDKIGEAIKSVEENASYRCFEGEDKFFRGRVLTTPYHYAYLKIADGCNNHCTYCAIPSIRGKYRSESISNLVCEARGLADAGVKELILVAQDVTRYGMDFDGKPHLIELLSKLCELDFEWIRLLYLEPEMVTDELIDFVKNNDKIAKYMDIPLQHVSSEVLKRMGRHTNEQSTYELLAKVREAGITVRSTFILGFPGESEEDFEKLKAFIEGGNIDYAGFFAYSREEGTAADRLDGHLPERVKAARVRALERVQKQVIVNNMKKLVGTVQLVRYDDINYEKQMFEGRMSSQAPEVDNLVYFKADSVEIGNVYRVLIERVQGIDLVGRKVQ